MSCHNIMCGITLFLSKNNEKNAVQHVLNSLYQLQNRGYDSFGIAHYDTQDKLFKIIKKAQMNGFDGSKDLYKDFNKLCENNIRQCVLVILVGQLMA